MLQAMNLSLSRRCPGGCIYCPTTRGSGPPPHDMPLAVAEVCIEEAAANGIRAFCVSENGEALMNPEALPILRLLRRRIPNARVAMFSNFALMTEPVVEALFMEDLVNAFYLNIDGIETYSQVKRLSYETMSRNLLHFLDFRGSRRVPLSIRILSRPRYRAAMRQLFGLTQELRPEDDGLDETDRVTAEWRPRLVPGLDEIIASPSVGWAHRDLVSGDQSRFACPNLARVENEVFVAPNGDWYPCCLMDQQNVVIGNLMYKELDQLAASDRRAQLLAALRERRYNEIGWPCTTVQACQEVDS